MSEVDEFLKGLEQESILNKPLGDKVNTPEEEEISLETEQRLKNRLMRKKEKEADRLREEVSQLNERVKILSEADKFKEEVGDDYKKLLEPIFGTAGDDGKYDPRREQATQNLISAFEKLEEKAQRKALEVIESQSSQDSKAEKEADSEVEKMLDQVEDDFNLDMSDDNVRSGYLTLMEKMSPKYEDGYIKEFADADAVAEAYVALQKRQGSTKAREIAGRSLTRSGESQPSKLEQSAVERFMEESGLNRRW